MRKKILSYIIDWESKGYPDGIPDEVPNELMVLNLAPSYKAICFAILKNDISLKTLGLSAPKSKYYYAIKGIALAADSTNL